MIDSPVTMPSEIVSMGSMDFDRAKADQLVQKLGAAIIAGDGYKAHTWDRLSLVFELDGQESQFGYVYTGDSAWTPATPGGFDALDIALDLQSAMQLPGKGRWKKALVQIVRSTGQIDIDFDYDGKKWVPNMADPAGFALSLRPAG